MASGYEDLIQGEWKLVMTEDGTCQNKTNESLYLLQGTAMPQSPITKEDKKSATLLKPYRSALITQLNGENIYAYTEETEVHVAIS